MSKTIEKQVLLEALRKEYEIRSTTQHRVVCQAIASNFPTLSPVKIKSLSFYLQLKQGQQSISTLDYPKHSFIIKFNLLNPQSSKSLQILTSKDIHINEDQFACVLNYQKYINVELLGETSIENQIAFWQSSEYCCSMSRKKFIEALKSAQVLKFSQNQIAFYEGQQITKSQSGSGVYVVRKGQFGYFKSTSKKQIETFRFESGHLFGALQIMQQQKVRSVTARCKTQSCTVYHFSQGDFKRIFLKYCSSTIYSKQQKLIKHLQNKSTQMRKSGTFSDSFRKTSLILSKNYTKPSFFSETAQSLKIQEQAQRKAFPFIKTEQIKKTAGSTFFKSVKESQRIQSESLKKTNFWSLKKEGPLKSYPMISQRSNFISSQFKGLQKLFLSKRDSVVSQPKQEVVKQNGPWKRDVIFSIYRQSFYKRRQNTSKMSVGIQ